MEQVNYIYDKLGNPKAANDLVDAVDAAILERLPNAESFENIQQSKSADILTMRYMSENMLFPLHFCSRLRCWN